MDGGGLRGASLPEALPTSLRGGLCGGGLVAGLLPPSYSESNVGGTVSGDISAATGIESLPLALAAGDTERVSSDSTASKTCLAAWISFSSGCAGIPASHSALPSLSGGAASSRRSSLGTNIWDYH